MQNKKRKVVNVIVTDEFVLNAKHLYRTALRFAKAQYNCSWGATMEECEKIEKHLQLLRKALTRFNYGVDPLEEGGAK